MAQHALLMMWMTAWTQAPCGSLPNDADIIRAKCKIPAAMWADLMPILMRGWWLAEDGRLYHDTIVMRVDEMLAHKSKEKTRKAAYRARLSAGSPQLSRGTDEGRTEESHGSDDTGTGTGTGTGIGKPTLVAKEDTEFQAHTARALEPGAVCKALKAKGIASVSPSNPALLALLNAGATLDEFESAAEKSATAKAGKPFNYLLSVMVSERERAKELAGTMQTGAMPFAKRTEKPAPMSFAERERIAGMERWEQQTGRLHPDLEAMRARSATTAGEVIDITSKPLELGQ